MIPAVERADLIPGWMGKIELAWLAETASALPQGSVWLEFGAYCGRSSMCVGLSLPPNSVLWIVDSFSPKIRWHTRGKRWHESVSRHDWVITDETPVERFMRTVSQLRSERPDLSVRFVNHPTSFAPRMIPAHSVNVAFIDADHDLQAVINDCAVCESLLVEGGLLCGHDYANKDWPDVSRAVDALYSTRVEVVPDTSIWHLP